MGFLVDVFEKDIFSLATYNRLNTGVRARFWAISKNRALTPV
jgi:hypothetical protein